jgi:ketosteroid isomerase-like protein
MMLCSLMIVPVLVIGLATPTLAQTADQQMRQQVEAVHMKWRDAVNKGDGEGLATVLAPNGFGIDAFGKLVGVEAASERIKSIHKKGLVLTTMIDDVQPLKGGQVAVASGSFTSKFTDPSIPPGQGNWVQVYEREGDGWKIRVVASSRVTLPAPTQ